MSPLRQTLLISVGAILAFWGLRSLPDTHCAFLHADHQPVIFNGVAFCGVNEEANYYQPQALQFPVKLEIKIEGQGGHFKLIKEDGRPFTDYEIGISHTEKVHLHLRQMSGRMDYIHLHPKAKEDGLWDFTFPEAFAQGNPGGEFQAFVDFVPLRTGRAMLAQSSAQWQRMPVTPSPRISRNQIKSLQMTTDKAGESAYIRVQLQPPAGKDSLKLMPIMGALGHAVLFGEATVNPGYAHIHPSLEGKEYEPQPTLSFRLRLPQAGHYDLWININDGAEDYLTAPITIKP